MIVFSQNKYKRSSKQENSSSIYSQLPQTQETQFAKQMAELQSDVRVCVCVCVRDVDVCVCVCVCVCEIDVCEMLMCVCV